MTCLISVTTHPPIFAYSYPGSSWARPFSPPQGWGGTGPGGIGGRSFPPGGFGGHRRHRRGYFRPRSAPSAARLRNRSDISDPARLLPPLAFAIIRIFPARLGSLRPAPGHRCARVFPAPLGSFRHPHREPFSSGIFSLPDSELTLIKLLPLITAHYPSRQLLSDPHQPPSGHFHP